MFAIDPEDPAPASTQLQVQMLAAIADGSLVPGERLATVRALAERLGIAPNTVARVYRALEEAGVIETRGRGGTFVSASTDPVRRQAQQAADAFAAQMRALHIDPDEAVAMAAAAVHGGR